jgi:hypothetical protein
MCFSELQFLAIVNDVKARSSILSAKSIIRRLPVIPTAAIYMNQVEWLRPLWEILKVLILTKFKVLKRSSQQ